MDKERRQGKGVFWLLQTKAEEEFIGVCEFNRIASCESGADVGCRLRTRWRGKGYMREALDAVIDYGFTVRRFTALYANIEPDNVESERLFQSLGFFPCGKISGFFGRRAFRRFVLRIGESG
jgi:ribosomal-protein-alanine N-acetyltransferase